MKRFIIEQSEEEFYTSHSGLALVGLAMNRFTSLASSLEAAAPTDDSISHADVIRSYCGILAQAKSDFVAVEQYRTDDFFREALGAAQVPSEGTMRQRMDDHTEQFLPAVSGHQSSSLRRSRYPLQLFPPATFLLISTGLSWTTPEAAKRKYNSPTPR